MPGKVHIITTGGTIDAEKYPDPEHPPKYATMPDVTLPGFKSNVMRYIEENLDRSEYRYELDIDLYKDSKNFEDRHFKKLAQIIKDSDCKNILITHGTDYTPQNSRRLQELLAEEGVQKKVIFTGAMTPLANGVKSDGPANIEFALSQFDNLESGQVRLAFHGNLFEPEFLGKDFKTMTFYDTRKGKKTN